MHIIKDENGNICEHAHSHEHTHTHTYEHSHPHDHSHGHEDEHNHTHEHDHEGEHCHSHEHCAAAGTEHCHTHEGHCHEHGHSHGEPAKNQTEALLQYMLDHNTHHAAELDQMAQKLIAEGHANAAEQIRKAVDEFQKGNLYLSLAISMVK